MRFIKKLWMWRACLLVVGVLWAPAIASGQLLYSFEPDLEGWGEGTVNANAAISKAQSTTGATQGTHSMVLEVNPGFTGDASVDGDAAVVSAIAATAGTGKKYDLRTDVTFAADSWSGLASQPTFFSLFLESNSSAGFQRNTLLTAPAQTQRTFHTRTPLEKVFPTPGSLGFAQFGIGKNDDHANGATGLKYYVDNMHIQEIQETQLFSWEGGFEDWENGFSGHPPHVRSIVTDYGVTSGTSAMQIVSTQTGFSWGSQFLLNTAPEQGQLDTLAAAINQADAIRFDVTTPDDQFSKLVEAGFPGAPPPNFLNVTVHVSDNTFAFYQAFERPIDLTPNTTTTVTIPLDELRANDTDLATAGFQGTSFFRFALATNQSGPSVIAIDNWRFVKDVVPGVPGDYNGNGMVDAADYVLWRNGGPLLNEVDTPGTVNAADYTEWRSRFGNSGGGTGLGNGAAVPEPATWIAALFGLAGWLMTKRQHGT